VWGVTTGLDSQSIEITEVHTPPDNLNTAVRFANPSPVPVLYLFSKIVKLKYSLYRGINKSLAPLGRKQATATEDPIYNHRWRNINTIYIYITRLASNEIF
jgi:hypothetical protein